MRPLRILFLCHNLRGIGTYVRAYHLARSLSLRGHRVTLMAVSVDSRFRTKTETESRLKIILSPNFLHGGNMASRLTSASGWGILDIYKRIREGMTSRYDIIQTFDHFPNVVLPFYYLRKRTDAKFVSDWCDIFHLPGGFRDTFRYRLDVIYRNLGFAFRSYFKSIEINIRKKADAVTVISHNLRNAAINYGIKVEKISVIEGGVDTAKIKPLAKMDCRKKVGLPLNGEIVLFLGRSQFDLDILIKSFAQIKKNIPNSYLVVVGSNLYNWTKQLATNLGVIDSYIETGHCSEAMLPSYLSCADVFALPMKSNLINETRWPNKIGEYLAAGRPTVVSDVGDVADVVRENEAGLVADSTVEDFTKKLKILLENQRLAFRLGNNARRVACEKFSWSGIAEKLEHVYLRIVSPQDCQN